MVTDWRQKLSWTSVTKTLWQIEPSIAVFLVERFHVPAVRDQVAKLVRAKPTDVLDVPQALPFLVGDRIEARVQRDLKVSFHSALAMHN